MFAEGVATVERALAAGRFVEARELANDLMQQRPPERFRACLEQLQRETLQAQSHSVRRLSLSVAPAQQNACFGDPLALVFTVENAGGVELRIPASGGDLLSALGLRTAERSLVRLQRQEISYDGLGIEWSEATSTDHELPADLALRPGDRFAWQRTAEPSARGVRKAPFRVVEPRPLRPPVVEAEGGSAHYYPVHSAKTRLFLWPEARFATGLRRADVEAALQADQAREVFLALLSCAAGERRAAMTSALALAPHASDRLAARSWRRCIAWIARARPSIERWQSWWESEGGRTTFWWERNQEG
ncbi:MAG: hypothetical protein U1E76_10085 [Planctomycetota bacterium]